MKSWVFYVWKVLKFYLLKYYSCSMLSFFFSGIFYLLSALHTNCFPANPLWTLFISIYSYSLSSLPSCEYLVCFQQNNLLSAASIVVFISRSPSLISFVSSCFTSYCLAKYFLNYSISILFCLRSWLFFFFKIFASLRFFFFLFKFKTVC